MGITGKELTDEASCIAIASSFPFAFLSDICGSVSRCLGKTHLFPGRQCPLGDDRAPCVFAQHSGTAQLDVSRMVYKWPFPFPNDGLPKRRYKRNGENFKTFSFTKEYVLESLYSFITGVSGGSLSKAPDLS